MVTGRWSKSNIERWWCSQSTGKKMHDIVERKTEEYNRQRTEFLFILALLIAPYSEVISVTTQEVTFLL